MILQDTKLGHSQHEDNSIRLDTMWEKMILLNSSCHLDKSLQMNFLRDNSCQLDTQLVNHCLLHRNNQLDKIWQKSFLPDNSFQQDMVNKQMNLFLMECLNMILQDMARLCLQMFLLDSNYLLDKVTMLQHQQSKQNQLDTK